MASYTSGSVVFSEFGMDALAFLAGGRRVAGGFGPDHGHAHRGRHLGVELDWHRDGAEFLDRMTQFDLALVHLDPLSRQGLGDVLGGHGPEQFVVLADLDGNRHGDRADLLRHLFKHGLLFTRLFGNHALGMFDRLQTATSRLHRFVPGEEKIAGITRGNLKNIPYVADSLQVLSQNYLHGYNFLLGRTADTTGARGESQRTATCDRGPASLE